MSGGHRQQTQRVHLSSAAHRQHLVQSSFTEVHLGRSADIAVSLLCEESGRVLCIVKEGSHLLQITLCDLVSPILLRHDACSEVLRVMSILLQDTSAVWSSTA